MVRHINIILLITSIPLIIFPTDLIIYIRDLNAMIAIRLKKIKEQDSERNTNVIISNIIVNFTFM